MKTFQNLPCQAVKKIFVWHQGGLGDVLLAAPALAAVSRSFPAARFIGVGQSRLWRLLDGTLPMAAVWDSGEALWAGLYQEDQDISPRLAERLAGMDLALVMSPRPRPHFLARLGQGGVPQVVWLPSFPEGGSEHVVTLQARRLEELGLREVPVPVRLSLETVSSEDLGLDPEDRVLVLAPGSGHPAKNWPLPHYYELARTLAWDAGLQVVWLAGPAEEGLLPYLEGLAAAQGQEVWVQEPLERVARLLARAQVFLGGDSGLSHLAAAAGARRVVVLYGPTDPHVWAPLGEQVTVLTPPGEPGPARSLADLPTAAVLAEVRRFL